MVISWIMKSKSTLQTFLAMAGSTLITITYVAAADYYWDGNDGTVGFQDTHPGPAGTWSSSTPSTATGGFTTDPSGSTVISANPNVTTTTADTVSIGTTDRDLPQSPLYAFTGPITIDGTVDVGYLFQADSSTTISGINTPTINFAAAGTFESAEVNLLSFPAVSLTGAGTSMTWKVGYGDNLTLHNFDGVTFTNGAAKNIITGPGRVSVNGKEDLGPDGTPLVLDGGMLRMIAGIAWNNYDDINTDHPLTFTPNKKLAVENRKGSAFTVSYTPDPTFAVVGAGGFESEGTSEVILNQNYAWTGPLVLTAGICSVESSANIGTGNDLVFNNGTLKIRGTTLTNFSTIGHTVVFTTDKNVGLNIDDALHTFTVDQALNQGTGQFNKTGPGTVILDQTSNSYTGTTTVSAGTLNVSNIPVAVSGLTSVTGTGTLTLSGDNSAATGAVTMNAAGAKLNLASAAALGTGTLTLQNGTLANTVTTLSTTQPIVFNGNFTFDGTNNLTFGSGAITNAGNRTVTLNGTNSTLTFGGVMTNTQANNQTTTVNGVGNTLVLGGYDIGNPTNTTDRTGTITGTGNVTITGPVTNGVGGATACALTKSGSGTLTLQGANSYAGTTTVNSGGELHLASGSQASAITVNSGAFVGFTLGSTITSTAALNLQTGHAVRIHGTPVAPNSYTLINAGSIGGTGVGTPTLESPITDYELIVDGTALKLNYVPSSTPFQDWALANGLDGTVGKENGKTDDPDGDGKNNNFEFAFNGNPLSGSDNGMMAGLVQDASAPAGNELTLVIAVRDGATFANAGSPVVQTATVDEVTYTIEGTLDLVTIPGSDVSHAAGPSDTAPLATGLPDLTGTDWEYHTFKLDASEGLGNKGFLRAKAE